MELATKQQVKAINAILATRGLMEVKKEMILQFTNERTDSSRGLYVDEAKELLVALNKGIAPSLEQMQKDRMVRKVIAIGLTVTLITKSAAVDTNGHIYQKKDFRYFDEWMWRYSYLHKAFKNYTFEELPKLITQLEIMEKDYLKKL